jgi:long-chain acyl-CoA synthetase
VIYKCTSDTGEITYQNNVGDRRECNKTNFASFPNINFFKSELPKAKVNTVVSNPSVVKSPSVVSNNISDEQKTRETIDEGGWLHTGDIGEMVGGKFLKITDRKKEIFKTSGGKFITPQFIENKLKESSYIENAMVIGEGHKFPAALIIPAFAAIRSWCERNDIAYTTHHEMVKDERVIQKIKEQVDRMNKDLSHHEMIKAFELLAEEWTIEKGELTPKLSLKRKDILRNNESIIAGIYQSETKFN